MATSEFADGVWDVQTRVLECYQYAQVNGVSLDQFGKVTYVPEPYPFSAQFEDIRLVSAHNRQLEEAADFLRDEVARTLARAVEVDQEYSRHLEAVVSGTYVCTEDASSPSPSLPDLPQASWSVIQVATWWKNLTDAERSRLISSHPGLIGNLNGVDGASRDRANRARLTAMRNLLAAEVARMKRELEKSTVTASFTPYQYRIAQQKLSDIEEILRQANLHPNYSLLTLDALGVEHIRVAFAIGNVDTAAHVATFVPGMTTDPTESLEPCLKHAARIQKAANDAHASSVAVIAWLGYDAPGNFGEPYWGEVALPSRADEGARLLSSFHEGLQASRQAASAMPGATADPHTTILGHSYGSTTSGKAVAQVNVEVVDDLVMFGSPGSGVSSINEYNLDSGTAYVSAVDSEDLVQGLGPDSTFGVNPTKLEGITHLSGDAPDPKGYGLFGRHSLYLEDVSGSLKDFGKVIAGRF